MTDGEVSHVAFVDCGQELGIQHLSLDCHMLLAENFACCCVDPKVALGGAEPHPGVWTDGIEESPFFILQLSGKFVIDSTTSA